MGVRLEYSANNSGGDWWLSDDDWRALEQAGWDVAWGGTYYCRGSAFLSAPNGKPTPCAPDDDCTGHRKANSAEEARPHRWLGSLAREASKEFATVAEGIREWEKVVGQSASDDGCGCCGAPHNFSWEGSDSGWASGEDVVAVLYPGSPPSLREDAEALSARNTNEDTD